MKKSKSEEKKNTNNNDNDLENQIWLVQAKELSQVSEILTLKWSHNSSRWLPNLFLGVQKKSQQIL